MKREDPLFIPQYISVWGWHILAMIFLTSSLILIAHCSNFTSWVYNYGLGNKFSSGLQTQSESAGRKLLVDEKFEKGDLLFISNLSGTAISHVVIYIDEETIIDSTVDSIDGVSVRAFKGWYKENIAFARRIVE